MGHNPLPREINATNKKNGITQIRNIIVLTPVRITPFKIQRIDSTNEVIQNIPVKKSPSSGGPKEIINRLRNESIAALLVHIFSFALSESILLNCSDLGSIITGGVFFGGNLLSRSFNYYLLCVENLATKVKFILVFFDIGQ